MTCREQPVGSVLTALARRDSSLADDQCTSTYHALLAANEGAPTPSEDEIFAQFDKLNAEVEARTDLSDKSRRSLLTRLAHARDPEHLAAIDGSAWAAWQHLRAECRITANYLENRHATLAARLGQSRAAVQERFDAYRREANPSRGVKNEPGRRLDAPADWQSAERSARGFVPWSRGTRYALWRLDADADALSETADTRPAVVRQTVVSAAMRAVGHNADTGRLEVEFHGSRVYAYRNVPRAVYEQMVTESAGKVFASKIRGEAKYLYDSKAQSDAHGVLRRCPTCGQFADPSHVCGGTAGVQKPKPETASALVPQTRRIPTSLKHRYADAAGDVYLPDPVKLRALLADNNPALVQLSAANIGANATFGPQVAGWFVAEIGPAGAVTLAPAGPEHGKARAPRCTCGTYRKRSRCEHLDAAAGRAAALLNDSSAVPVPLAGSGTPLVAELPAGTIAVSGPHRSHRAESLYLSSIAPIDLRGKATDVDVPIVTDAHLSFRSSTGEFVTVQGWYTVKSVGTKPARFQVTAAADGDEEAGLGAVRAPRCSCADYQQNGRCVHIDESVGHMARRVGRGASPLTASTMRSVRADAAEKHAASVIAQRQAVESWQDPQIRYADDWDSFKDDYRAALERAAAGETVMPLVKRNATGGLGGRDGGRPFGVEVEFGFPDDMGWYERKQALANIGTELHAAGLTAEPEQQPYGTGAIRYRRSHRRGWSFETDDTVDGEIISPIMWDEPQTWNNLSKVCDVVRRNGGLATPATGGHVHVSVGDYDHEVEHHARLLALSHEHEDVLYRLAADPDRGVHRGLHWCAPNTAPSAAFASVEDVHDAQPDRHVALNFDSVTGDRADHVEFRAWDGSLDPAVIQARTILSLALTEAAFREAGSGMLGTREAVGEHASRTQGRQRMSESALRADTASFRGLADRILPDKCKAQVTALFAMTRWQRAAAVAAAPPGKRRAGADILPAMNGRASAVGVR